MPQFLFIVEVPASKAMSDGPGLPHEWTVFANTLSTIPNLAKKSVRLQLNAWLINAEGGYHVLENLSANAKDHDLSYTVLLIPDGVITLVPPKP